MQGTVNGYGERCGNANLVSIIPALKLKMGFDVVSDEQLERLTETSHFVADVVNRLRAHAPYVGRSAFAHKGGMHVAAVEKSPQTFEHIDPEKVGNEQRIVVSELSVRVPSSARRRSSACSWRATTRASPPCSSG